MKAVVFRGVGNIRLDGVPEPQIQELAERYCASHLKRFYGSDLHMIWGTMSRMKPDAILGQEAAGIVEQRR